MCWIVRCIEHLKEAVFGKNGFDAEANDAKVEEVQQAQKEHWDHTRCNFVRMKELYEADIFKPKQKEEPECQPGR